MDEGSVTRSFVRVPSDILTSFHVSSRNRNFLHCPSFNFTFDAFSYANSSVINPRFVAIKISNNSNALIIVMQRECILRDSASSEAKGSKIKLDNRNT